MAVTGVSVSGNTAVMTLATAPAFGQAAAVTYAPGTNRLRDTAGNEAAALSSESVTVIDETAPTLLSATVEGTALKLVYDEALKATPAPVASDFTVTVAGSARTVSGVAISGATVTLTLSSAVSSGETVTLDYTAGTNPIQDAAGNQAADLSGQAVDEADTAPPTLSTATVEGTSLILTYNEALDATSEPAASDFTVTVAGSARTVSGVAVSGMTVTLTLGSAVTAGQAVTLDYTAGTNPIQDTSGNDAAGLSAQTVTIVDTMAPVIRGATVEGTTLILTYSEALDGTSTPVASDFTVTVDGSARTVSSVAISGATVTLTLASAVTPGQAVTVAYTSGTNPIEDAAGNDAADLTARAADEVDTTPPTLSTATVEGTTLILTYNEALDGNSTPAASDFTVTVNGSARSVSGVALSGMTVTLSLSSAVTAGQTVTVSYTAGANAIQDAEGNDAAGLSNQAVTIVDTTAPVLRFATVEGTTLILTYGEALKAAPLPATGDFTVTVAGSARSVSSVAISGVTVTLTLSSAVTAGQAVTVSYTAGTNPIQDAAGNEAADLTNRSVDEVDTMAPTLSSATVARTMLTLTYNEALSPSSAPAGTDFSVVSGGNARTVSDVAVAGSTVTLTLSPPARPGETVTVSYTAGANPIEDVQGNDAASLSNEAVTNNTVAQPPDPPTNLTASGAAPTRISLSWRAPSDDGGSVITGYRIERSGDGSDPWEELVADTGDAATTHEDAMELSAGTTRHYRVSAGNSEGFGSPSSPASATTPTSVGRGPGGGGGGGGGGSVNAPPKASAAIANALLRAGRSLEIDLSAHFSDPDGEALKYAAESSDEAVAAVELDGAALTVRGAGPAPRRSRRRRRTTGGRSASQSFAVTVSAAGAQERIWHLPPASDPLRQGFVRVVNHSDAAGEASIVATDRRGYGARAPDAFARTRPGAALQHGRP